MSNDSLERRSYRKSPGRQYGYDYDPLRSQNGSTASKPDALLVQRPDPRRTRQFLRQSIIASKRSTSQDSEPVTYHEQESEILNISASVAQGKKTRRIRYTSQDLAAYAEHSGEVATSHAGNPSVAQGKKTRRIRYTSQDLAASAEHSGEVATSRSDNPSVAQGKKTRRIRYTSQDLAANAEHSGEVATSHSDNPSVAQGKKTRRIRYTSQDLAYDEQKERDSSSRFGTRSPSRAGRFAQPHLPATRDLARDIEETHQEWDGFIDEDPDQDLLKTERPLYEEYAEKAVRPTMHRRRRDISSSALVPQRSVGLPERDELLPDDYDPNRIYEEDEELPAGLRVVKNRKPSRRGLLVGVGMGVGMLAVGGVVAASNLASKAGPQSDHTSHAMQEAFNRGVAQGADSTRREFVSALDALEGFSLQGAIDAAKLTRVAYDVFVSPVVQFGSQLTTDFLSSMVSALKTARGWLAGIYQDNTTLAAIQHVLQSWVDQVSKLPKQLDAITQTDLDGAQAYLTALQRKIADEKNKLNNPHPTSIALPASKSTPVPKPHR
jgi:hypothetical protein